MNLNFEHLCHNVIELCREVGIFIKMEESKVKLSDVEEKSLNSLVSYVDKTAEQNLVDGLSQLIPEAGFIAEEGTSSKKGNTYNWIIDPLDGTTNFLYGIPTYAVSVALQKDDQIVVGVVYEVNRDECFYAWQNGGAHLNGEMIKVKNTPNLSQSLLATGFPYYDFERIDSYFQLLKKLAESTRGVRRIGSAAVDLVYVACGRFDGFFEYSLHPWDVAAGALIVQEAGGVVCDFSGTDNWLFGKEIIASSKAISTNLTSLIKSTMLPGS